MRKTMKDTPCLMKASNTTADCTQSITHLSLTPELPYFFNRRLIQPILAANATIWTANKEQFCIANTTTENIISDC